jgi:DMSO/TMAO reductase YedYZ molybdopterin-dependent catalytic subunit
VIHLVVYVPVALRAFAERGVLSPLRQDLAHTPPEPPEPETTAPTSPAAPTVTRRWLLGLVGSASAGLGVMAAGQSVGGPFRGLALLAPRGRSAGDGPNDFLVNKTAASRGIDPAATGAGWRLQVRGNADPVEFDRDRLLAMPLATHALPIACVEGWSTTQDWTGVPLRDLARLVAVDPDGTEAFVESLQESGSFREVTLAPNQVADERTLLALRVNDADLSLDHGFPARLIVPGAPGVHCTKWVSRIAFTEVAA